MEKSINISKLAFALLLALMLLCSMALLCCHNHLADLGHRLDLSCPLCTFLMGLIFCLAGMLLLPAAPERATMLGAVFYRLILVDAGSDLEARSPPAL